MKKQIIRCTWVPQNNELFEKYHDKEWGVSLHDDTKIFEFLTLESAQAGLSWAIVLKKRLSYKEAFVGFDPTLVASFTKQDVERLLKNPGIIRNRAKIEAAINNARQFLAIQEEFGSFAKYMWSFVNGHPKVNAWKTDKQIPATSKEAVLFSNDLKKRGFKFLGPTTCYAHMQAVGMINDHLISCFRYSVHN